jgi:hypothetical protein
MPRYQALYDALTNKRIEVRVCPTAFGSSTARRA